MLMPKKVKYRKQQRGRMTGAAKGGATVAFGDYGIQALEPGWITARQIEAARIAMTRHVRRGGKVWIRVFPDKPVTQKQARRDPNGLGKGQPRALGSRRQAGSDPLRALRRRRHARSGGDGTGDTEAPDQGAFHRPSGHRLRERGARLVTKAAELRELADNDLETKVVEARRELFNLRFQLATGRLDNIARIPEVRREIARLLTLQGERARGEEI